MQDRKDYLSIFDNEENFLDEFLRIGKRVVKIAKKKYPLQYEDFIDTLVLYAIFIKNEDMYSISKNTNEFCHELFDSLENIDYKSEYELDLFATKWRQELQNRNDNGSKIIDHILGIVNYTLSKSDLELEKFFLDSEVSLSIGRTLKENLLPFCKGNMFSEKLTDKLLTFVNFNPLFCGHIYYELSLELTKNCVTPVFERYKRIYEKDTGIIPCGNEFLTFIQNNYPVHCLDGGSIKQMLSEYMDFEVNSHYSLPKNRKYKKQTIDITPHQTLSIEAAAATVEDGIKLIHREIATLCYINGLTDLTYPQAEELALFYKQKSRKSGQRLKEQYWNVIVKEEGMNHKYNAEIYTHSNSYQSILKIIPLLEKEECIKLAKEYLKKSEPYKDVKSK